jgi:hypothetical protein
MEHVKYEDFSCQILENSYFGLRQSQPNILDESLTSEYIVFDKKHTILVAGGRLFWFSNKVEQIWNLILDFIKHPIRLGLKGILQDKMLE